MIQFVAFVAASAIVAWLSRRNLRDRRVHGFYRFFAFEAILALGLLNLEVWFDDPFSARQILSWLVLCVAGLLAIHGFHLLRVVGRPQGGVESTTTLVEVGAYRYIRHPLYASLLWLAWGTFLKDPSPAGVALALAASAFLFGTAKVEESEMLARFGTAYAEYMGRTKRFVPYVV